MKKNKLKLTLALAAVMTMGLAGGYCDDINIGNTNLGSFNETAYALSPAITVGSMEYPNQIRAGETIEVKIRMKTVYTTLNVVKLQFKYDTNVFEDIQITPGELCSSHPEGFTGKVDKDEGKIELSF